MRILVITIFIVSLSLIGQDASSQTTGEADPLFQSNDVLQVTLEAPLNTLVRKKSKEDYLTGLFRYTDADGSRIEFDVKLRARGNFRHDNCDYPPVWLRLKKSQTKNTLFDKQDKLKLVVHCDSSPRYHQIVLREYLAYRIQNALSDLSLRVRLLQINYVDTDKQRRSEPRYAFLIEHKDRAAKRIGLKELEVAHTQVSQIYPAQLNLTSIFEYFIGNTDFSPIAGAPGEDCCHNYILFKKRDTKITATPYDFDQSGFVDAPYANPSPRFRLRSVKQRLYRGRCINNEQVENSIQQFRDKRDIIHSLLEGQEGFTEDTREELTDFVDKFYKVIENPKDIENLILEKCL